MHRVVVHGTRTRTRLLSTGTCNRTRTMSTLPDMVRVSLESLVFILFVFTPNSNYDGIVQISATQFGIVLLSATDKYFQQTLFILDNINRSSMV